jgi:hypothetical protein
VTARREKATGARITVDSTTVYVDGRTAGCVGLASLVPTPGESVVEADQVIFSVVSSSVAARCSQVGACVGISNRLKATGRSAISLVRASLSVSSSVVILRGQNMGLSYALASLGVANRVVSSASGSALSVVTIDVRGVELTASNATVVADQSDGSVACGGFASYNVLRALSGATITSDVRLLSTGARLTAVSSTLSATNPGAGCVATLGLAVYNQASIVATLIVADGITVTADNSSISVVAGSAVTGMGIVSFSDGPTGPNAGKVNASWMRVTVTSSNVTATASYNASAILGISSFSSRNNDTSVTADGVVLAVVESNVTSTLGSRGATVGVFSSALASFTNGTIAVCESVVTALGLQFLAAVGLMAAQSLAISHTRVNVVSSIISAGPAVTTCPPNACGNLTALSFTTANAVSPTTLPPFNSFVLVRVMVNQQASAAQVNATCVNLGNATLFDGMLIAHSQISCAGAGWVGGATTLSNGVLVNVTGASIVNFPTATVVSSSDLAAMRTTSTGILGSVAYALHTSEKTCGRFLHSTNTATLTATESRTIPPTASASPSLTVSKSVTVTRSRTPSVSPLTSTTTQTGSSSKSLSPSESESLTPRSDTDSGSISLPLSPTGTLLPRPLPVPIDRSPGTVAVAVDSVATVSSVVLGSVSPSVATMAGRQSALRALIACSDSDASVDAPGRNANALQLSWSVNHGADPATVDAVNLHAGGVALSSIWLASAILFFLAVSTTFVLQSSAWARAGKPRTVTVFIKHHLPRGSAFVRFPGSIGFVYAYTSGIAAQSAVIVIGSPGSELISVIVVAVVSVAITLLPLATYCIMYRRHFRRVFVASAVEVDPAEVATGAGSVRHWLFSPATQWCPARSIDVEEGYTLQRQWCFMFDGYSNRAPWFLAVETGWLGIVGGITAQLSASLGCAWGAWLTFFVYGVFVGLLVLLRPYAVPIELFVQGLVAVCQALVALLAAILTAKSEADSLTTLIGVSEMVGTIAGAALSLLTVLSVFVAVKSFLRSRLGRRKLKHALAKEQDQRERAKRGRLLLNNQAPPIDATLDELLGPAHAEESSSATLLIASPDVDLNDFFGPSRDCSETTVLAPTVDFDPLHEAVFNPLDQYTPAGTRTLTSDRVDRTVSAPGELPSEFHSEPDNQADDDCVTLL